MNNIPRPYPRVVEITRGVFRVEVLRGKTSWAMAFCEGATAVKTLNVATLLITDDASCPVRSDRSHLMTVTAEGVRYRGNNLSPEKMKLAIADIANTPMERQEAINILVGTFVWYAGYNVITYVVEQAIPDDHDSRIGGSRHGDES